MFEKSDQNFQALLDDDAKRNQWITDLAKARANLLIAAGIQAAILIFTLAILMKANLSDVASRNPHPISITTPVSICHMTSFTLIVCSAMAIAAHCDLRMLLLFKKLRDDKSGVTP